MSTPGRALLVIAALRTGEECDAEDEHVPGVYWALVDVADNSLHADAALDAFHSAVPVDNLDPFYFYVVDPLTHIVLEPAGAEAYSLTEKAQILERVKGAPVWRVARYRVYVSGEGLAGDLTLGEVSIAGVDGEAMRQKALARFWDARLHDAGLQFTAQEVGEAIAPADEMMRPNQAQDRPR